MARSVKKRALRRFRELLLERDRLRREYADRPVVFLRGLGHRFPPKHRKLFLDVYSGKVHRAAAVAPRGGGKTFLAADLALAFFLFKRWNVIIVAGSLEQAMRVVEYIQDVLGDPEVMADLGEFYETKTLVKDPSHGNWIKAAPASTKAIRGLHSRGRPVLLIMDEEAEMEERIVRAALSTVTEASEYRILRISTNHNVYGTFYELVEAPEKHLYRLYRWDGFDICRIERMKDGEPDWDHYLEPYRGIYGEVGIRKAKEDLRAYWRALPRPEGTGEEGWAPFRQKVVENYFTLPREWFEVEEMGGKPSGRGLIIRPEDLEAALVDGVEALPHVPKWVGVDWGFAGMTAVVVLQRVGEEIQVLEALEFSHTLTDEILQALLELHRRYGVREVYADASHPFNNEHIRRAGFLVDEVAFSTFKERGVGRLQHLFERGNIRIPRRLQTMIQQLRNWRRDEKGRIVKKDDHFPDALVAGMKRLEGVGIPAGVGLRFGRLRP
ncbi:MAG: hypothetical protein L3J76_01750 [Candidatus Hydrothermae bacterium]|nr:hypothetical protein [Candidatus Hydrothermae bacterium]